LIAADSLGDGFFVSDEFRVSLDATVGDGRALSEVSVLSALVSIEDGLLLVSVQHKQITLFSGGKVLVSLSSGVDLRLKNGEERVILVLHDSLAQTGEGRLEELILDHGAFGWVGKLLLDLGEGLRADVSNKTLKVSLLVALDGVQHVLGTAVHVMLEVGSGVGEEVDKSSLFDEVVLLVDANVLDLLLRGGQVLHLHLFNVISPLGDELLALISRVHVVEVSELGSDHEREVTSLRDTQVQCKDVLVMEDHTSNPLVVGPATEAGEGGDGADVEPDEEDTTARSAEGLVVGRDLLGADSLEQSLHVVEVVEADGVLSGVVGVFVALAHVHQLVLIVALAVLFFILGLSPVEIIGQFYFLNSVRLTRLWVCLPMRRLSRRRLSRSELEWRRR